LLFLPLHVEQLVWLDSLAVVCPFAKRLIGLAKDFYRDLGQVFSFAVAPPFSILSSFSPANNSEENCWLAKPSFFHSHHEILFST